MPEMHFFVRWPDETLTACYSPSLVVREYLEVGRRYPLAEFVERSRDALTIGSRRIEATFGRPCSLAHAQLGRILAAAERFAGVDDATVTVERFDPPG